MPSVYSLVASVNSVNKFRFTKKQTTIIIKIVAVLTT